MATAVSSLAFNMEMQGHEAQQPWCHHLTHFSTVQFFIGTEVVNLFLHKQLANEPQDSDVEGLFPGLLSVNQDDIY